MEKKPVFAITAGILIIAAGFVFLMDYLNFAFNGAIDHWYVVLIIWGACNLLALAIAYKAPLYYCLATTLGGVFVALLVSITVEKVDFDVVWPIIPMFFGFGILVANAVAHRPFAFLKTGILISLLSIALLVGAALNAWRIVLPIVVMLAGLTLIINTLIRLNIKTKEGEADYRVTPTKDKESNEKSDTTD